MNADKVYYRVIKEYLKRLSESLTGTGTIPILSSTNTTIQNPVYDKYTDSINLVSDSDIGAVDDTYVDKGAEIDCRGYKTIGLYIDFTVNNSTGNQLQVLSSHESGGDRYIMEAIADYQKTIGDASIKIFYEFNVESVPYIQLQTKATLVGATEGTVTIDLIKEY